jgi:hypothetical protein
MLSATAQIRAITPWSMLGGRGGRGGNGIAAIVVERTRPSGEDQKKFAEPVAVSSTTPVDFPFRPLRAAPYDLPVLLRPTPAPRSAHEGIYGLSGHGARVPKHEKAAICER